LLVLPLNEEMSLVQECPKAPHSPQPHCRLQHGRIGRFPDRAPDSDGYCDSFAHAFVSNVPAQRRGRALIRHAEITRFEAVRLNKQVKFLMQTSGTGWLVGTDSNGNGTIDATDKQQLIASFATLLPSGVAPSPTAITNGFGGAQLSPRSPVALDPSRFDARGAIRVGGSVSSSVFVFYIGSTTNPDFGFRAVVFAS